MNGSIIIPFAAIAQWAWPIPPSGWIWGSLAISILMFAGSLWLAWRMIIALPADYLTRQATVADETTGSSWLAWIARNVAGGVMILAGLVMLFTPGQGLLFILIGLMLTSFPGKKRWLQWLFRKPQVRRSVNQIRERAGQPPMQLEVDSEREST